MSNNDRALLKKLANHGGFWGPFAGWDIGGNAETNRALEALEPSGFVKRLSDGRFVSEWRITTYGLRAIGLL